MPQVRLIGADGEQVGVVPIAQALAAAQDAIDKATFESLTTNRKILKWFRDNDYLTAASAGLCSVDDDQYNVTICDRSNNRPLFAIEYGPEY